MSDLFLRSLDISKEQFENVSQQVPKPLKGFFSKAYSSGALQIMVDALFTAGFVADLSSAIVYLLNNVKVEDIIIGRGDHKGVQLSSQLRRILGKRFKFSNGNGQSVVNLMHHHGTLGHMLMTDLLNNCLMWSIPEGSFQIEINFLSDEEKSSWYHLLGSPILPKDYVKTELAIELRTVLTRMRRKVKLHTHADRKDKTFRQADTNRLRVLLMPVIGNYIKKLDNLMSGFGEGHAKYLTMLTLMTWGYAVLWVGSQPEWYFVSEIPTVHSKHGVGGGRLDIVRVLPQRGTVFSPIQESTLRTLSNVKFVSLSHVYKWLRKHVGKNFRLVIYDWKFFVGDQTGKNVITVSDVKKSPLKPHLRQMKYYILFVSLATYIERVRKREWGMRLPVKVVYLTPVRWPLMHRIFLTRELFKEELEKFVSVRWHKASENAHQRASVKSIVDGVVRLKKKSAKNVGQISQKTEQRSLFPSLSEFESRNAHKFQKKKRIYRRKGNGKNNSSQESLFDRAITIRGFFDMYSNKENK